MNLLVKMLKTVKTPQIRVRVCSVIGLLIRHSTVIENDVAESEVCSQLVDVLMRDKNEKVRRKAVAALGEFMFYAAT
jgi:serine/threonine-protein kinase ULK4